MLRLISRKTGYMLNGMLNSAYSLTHVVQSLWKDIVNILCVSRTHRIDLSGTNICFRRYEARWNRRALVAQCWLWKLHRSLQCVFVTWICRGWSLLLVLCGSCSCISDVTAITNSTKAICLCHMVTFRKSLKAFLFDSDTWHSAFAACANSGFMWHYY